MKDYYEFNVYNFTSVKSVNSNFLRIRINSKRDWDDLFLAFALSVLAQKMLKTTQSI